MRSFSAIHHSSNNNTENPTLKMRNFLACADIGANLSLSELNPRPGEPVL